MTVLVGARDAEPGPRRRERALRAGGARRRFVPLDVTDEESIAAAAADWIDDEYGQLDILVNNAGIVRADGAGLPERDHRWRRCATVFETNVFGVVAVTNAMLPLLRRAPAARIVNVSSEVGSIALDDRPGRVHCGADLGAVPASKAALNMVTAMYAKELRDTPIKVNAANPGYCATDLNGTSGFRTAEQGAEVSVHLATLPADGPTGRSGAT